MIPEVCKLLLQLHCNRTLGGGVRWSRALCDRPAGRQLWGNAVALM